MTSYTTADCADTRPLIDLLRGRSIVVLAGAGCSTESGIPDYRGPEGALRKRSPMQYGEFVGRPEGRARYWARSMAGWTRVANAEPNPGHLALAGMEASGAVCGVITQNVDGLHQKAGSRRVVELHGSVAFVRCLDCGERDGRDRFQRRLLEENPGFAERLRIGAERRIEASNGIANGVDKPGLAVVERRVATGADRIEAAPDGDAELPNLDLAGFSVPSCECCGGVIKPDVVFFGENVPRERVDQAWSLFAEADALLVVGSSLTVFSGRRFIYRAAKEGVPIAIVNVGPTRADEHAAVKVEARLGTVLPSLAEALDGDRRRPVDVRAGC